MKAVIHVVLAATLVAVLGKCDLSDDENIQVPGQSAICVSDTMLSLSCKQGDSLDGALLVWNSGSGQLDYQIDCDEPWVHVALVAGASTGPSDIDTIILTIRSRTLSPHDTTYVAWLVLTSAIASAETVAIELYIREDTTRIRIQNDMANLVVSIRDTQINVDSIHLYSVVASNAKFASIPAGTISNALPIDTSGTIGIRIDSAQAFVDEVVYTFFSVDEVAAQIQRDTINTVVFDEDFATTLFSALNKARKSLLKRVPVNECKLPMTFHRGDENWLIISYERSAIWLHEEEACRARPATGAHARQGRSPTSGEQKPPPSATRPSVPSHNNIL